MNTAIAILLSSFLWQVPADSVPQREGSLVVPALREESIELRFDDHGVPWIVGTTVAGLCQGEGFVHGQDRFFQMDLMRRYAAGELAGILGSRGQAMDRNQRPFLHRDAADAIVASLPPRQLEALEAYAEGVNAGVRSLGGPPPEYMLLQEYPAEWTPADSILVLLSMGDQLSSSANMEMQRARVRSKVSQEMADYLFGNNSVNDRPMIPDGIEIQLQPIPDRAPSPEAGTGTPSKERPVPGSNAWAVAGSRTPHGGAILASDPHLGLSAPGPWYRVGLFAPAGSPAAWDEEAWWVFGLSLPGLPGVVIGSNGHVAWGFTNAGIDDQDYVVIEDDPVKVDHYLVPGGSEPYEWRTETLDIAGEAPVTFELPMTRWGPMTTSPLLKRKYVRKWIMTEPGGVNLDILDLPWTRNVDEAIGVLRHWYGPPQNAIVVDDAGDIGWTITGRFPNRNGFDGFYPEPWTEPGMGWDGWLDESARPVLLNPEGGVIYSANNRMADVETARRLGREWAAPHRAARIADMLASEEQFEESDLAAMQLDTRVASLDHVRDHVLRVIPADDPDELIRKARTLVAEWNGTADADQRGFRLLAMLDRRITDELLWTIMSGETSLWSVQSESLHRLVDEDATDYLPGRFENWDEFYDHSFRAIARQLESQGGVDLPWGEANQSSIQHPFAAQGAPGMEVMNLPMHPQAGHPLAVRVAHPSFGASARMVVSPGREQMAMLQTPGGQSGHFLSPHYTDYHEEWRRGDGSGFLPGEPRATLRLVREAEPATTTPPARP